MARNDDRHNDELQKGEVNEEVPMPEWEEW